MILKSNSLSATKCWSRDQIMSWSWFSLFLNRIGCFGLTDKSWVFFGINSRVWNKSKYDSVSWNMNI